MSRPTAPDNSAKKATPTRLEKKLDTRLFAYAAAASAAGVGLLALVPGAEAKIVYTAANLSIPNGRSVEIDLAQEGVPDFTFYFYAYGPSRKLPLGEHSEALSVIPHAGNAVWEIPNSTVGECAAALPPGVKVGAGAGFQSKRGLLWGSFGTAYSGPFVECEWGKLTRGAYLGVRFVFDGTTHYGWVHLKVNSTAAVVDGYAYESVPDQPIDTGKTSGPSDAVLDRMPIPASQPATLRMLAQGAHGLTIWRRPEEQEVA
jgi:hypothetical protein